MHTIIISVTTTLNSLPRRTWHNSYTVREGGIRSAALTAREVAARCSWTVCSVDHDRNACGCGESW